MKEVAELKVGQIVRDGRGGVFEVVELRFELQYDGSAPKLVIECRLREDLIEV